MTKIGIVGCGKLGTPVSVAIGQKFPVIAYDVNPALRKKRPYEHMEKGPTGQDDFQKYFDKADITFVDSIEQVCQQAEIIFVAVQTPHKPELDGSLPVGQERADFDYAYLKMACKEIAHHIRKEQTVAIISTVLPGTMRREIAPILGDSCNLLYNPYFIAMSTVMSDFNYPEFVLIGGEKNQALRNFYLEYYDKDMCLPMSYESAEMTKCAYNSHITQRLVFINSIMEMCHKIPGCNIEDVSNALCKAKQRITSSRYLRGGMGDGGYCHPRDLISMSYIAGGLDLSHNIFNNLIFSREDQTEWLAKLFIKEAGDLPLVVFGKAFKADTNIVAGSPAMLFAHYLQEQGKQFVHYDPHIEDFPYFGEEPHIVSAFFVATKHSIFARYEFPKGSIVVDPWRFIQPQDGVKIIPVGIGL